jgi:hypothetical protein
LHAFEVFDEIGPASATWWGQARSDVSSLQITAVVATCAHRTARHDPAVAAHPWLARATDYCLGAAAAAVDADEPPHALVLAFTLRFLDAVNDSHPAAAPLLGRLGRFVPADGVLPVAGGTAEEAVRPLDIAPEPGRPVRALFSEETVAAELRRLAAGQQPDGGWRVDYAEFSPAGAMDWRGHATVRALATLRANGPL